MLGKSERMHVGTLPARWTLLIPWRTLAIATGVLALIARRPEALLRPQFVWEEASVFYVPTFFLSPPELIGHQYGGYLQVIPRLVVYLDRLVPPAVAPTVSVAVGYGVMLAVGGFLASERLANVLSSAWARLAVACAIVLAPSVADTMGTIVNVHWYFAVYLVALALARPALAKAVRWGEYAAVALIGLSGPFALLLAPIFWPRRDRLALIVTATGLVQLITILVTPQRSLVTSLAFVPEAMVIHGAALFVGPMAAALMPPIAVLVALTAATAIAWRVLPRRVFATLLYASAVIVAAGMVASGPAIADAARNGERYFLVAFVSLSLVIVAGLTSPVRWTRLTSAVIAGAMLFGIASSYRLPEYPDTHWQASSRCIGSVAACEIPIYPSQWSVRWPGLHGEYDPPDQPL